MTEWDRARRRYRLVHDVAAAFEKKGPRALTERQAELVAEYGDLDHFLRDVQRRYLTAAYTGLDAAIEETSGDPRVAVADALAAVAEVYPAFWRLLKEYADHPALAEGQARFRHTVLSATGVDPTGLMSYRPHQEVKGISHARKSAFCAALRPVRAWLH
ncbi:hypothetical protein GCM10023196_055420 [Actinoallomurus vinaceus]|uniref:M3 family oligoendopeptidase n=1 Tax=Actinoallomurus vinaceus TaxID=1080074 RepID=A0ABP8UHE0_9ACTN